MAIFTRIVIFFLLLSITIPYFVLSHSNGAATCDVTLMSSQGHGPATTSGVGGYSLAIKNSTSGSFEITISGPNSVKGLLIYTQDPQGTRTGNFVIPSNFQSKSCGGSGTNSVTHTDASEKSMPLKFTWSPVSGSTTSTTVRALVVVSYNDWYQLGDLTFDTSSGTIDNSTTTVPSGNSSSGGSGSSGDNFFQQNTLFVVMILITAVLYVIGCFVELSLRKQQVKARAFAKAVGGYDQ